MRNGKQAIFTLYSDALSLLSKRRLAKREAPEESEEGLDFWEAVYGYLVEPNYEFLGDLYNVVAGRVPVSRLVQR